MRLVSALALALTLAATRAFAQAPSFDLPMGPHGVGHRIHTLRDPTRPAPFGADPASTLPVAVHVWYPASATPAAGCLTFGDYLALENGPVAADARPARIAEAREGFAGMLASFPDTPTLTDEGWQSITSTRLRGCLDAPPLAGRHPVLVGRFLGGLWTLQAEYFASHGYVVAMVVSPGGINLGAIPAGDRVRAIARQLEHQVRDFDVLVSMVLARDPTVDLSRAGVLGQSIMAVLFAMQRPGLVKAIALQDAPIFTGGMTSDAGRRSASWNPGGLAGALMLATSRAASAPETYLADFEAMSGAARYRLRVATPVDDHEALTSSGYVARRALALGGTHRALVAAFEANLRAQHLFFDAHVRGDAERRRVLDESFATLVPPAVATMEVTPARPR